MESSVSSPTQALIFYLEIPVKLPSWNEILGMNHWRRKKFKDELAKGFLSALRASANDSSMRTTCAKNTMSIFADTLESYLATKQAKRKLKQRSARLKKTKKKR